MNDSPWLESVGNLFAMFRNQDRSFQRAANRLQSLPQVSGAEFEGLSRSSPIAHLREQISGLFLQQADVFQQVVVFS